MHPGLARLIALQQAAYHEAQGVAAPQLDALVARALTPDDIRNAVLREAPLLAHRRAPPRADIAEVREELAAVSLIDATPDDLAFRRLFPTLDDGIYCASHATGKPSIAWTSALEAHLSHLRQWGLGAWEAGWTAAEARFRERVSTLVGGDPEAGAVARYLNVSDALSAILNGGLRGRLVTAEDHFTTAHYIHEAWANRTGSEVVEVAEERDGSAPLAALCDALTRDTEVVSVATASWRTGVLLDVYALSEAIMDICPDATLIVDAYQTLGTVPLHTDRLAMRTAVLGGGLKQLRAGTGAGFAWISHPLLEELEPDRTGWFGHVAPFAFAPPPMVLGNGATKLQTGCPDPTGALALTVELDVLASVAGGSLEAAVRRTRSSTAQQVRTAIALAEHHGLQVVGDVPPEARAAFFAIRVPDGAIVADLAREGLMADFRADIPGGKAGVCRISANAASFDYELAAVVDGVATRMGVHA